MPAPKNPFPKGNKLNPIGANAHDPKLRAVRKLTRSELADVGALMVKGDVDALTKIRNDPKETALRAIIASVCLRALNDGDMRAFDVLLNRLIGKVKDEVVVGGDIPSGAQIVVSLPSNGREVDKPK